MIYSLQNKDSLQNKEKKNQKEKSDYYYFLFKKKERNISYIYNIQRKKEKDYCLLFVLYFYPSFLCTFYLSLFYP